MRKICGILIMLLGLFNTGVIAQFSTSNSAPYNSAFYLINNVFAGGNVSISNVVSYGAASQIGFFSGNPVIGMDSGVVLSTGTINGLCNGNCPNASSFPAPPGTANGVNFGFPWMGGGTNPVTNNNLYNVSASVPGLLGFGSSPNDVNDAAAISFDFVPTLDTMRFKFVFASEEWPTYPCSMFNDVFGFFVSGPGINGGYFSPPGYPNGAENYALIPNTNIPITITSINAPGYSPSSCTNSYSQYFVPNVATNSGMTAHYTTVMEVVFVVQPCQTYNFTMAIADGSDGILSSYVLMEANSFAASGVSLSFNSTYNFGGDSILYEGCGSVTMDVVRADNIQNADTIHFNIWGNATNGVDYTLLPDSFVFAAGQDTFSHTFTVPNDFIIEGPETIMVSVTDTDLLVCTGTGDTLMVVIQDPIPLTSDAWTDTIMCTQNAQLAANPLTGLMPLQYIWSTTDTTDTINITPTPTVSTDYYVTMTDACSAFTIIDTAHLIIQNPIMSIDAPGDTIDCEATGAPVFVNITNQMPQTQILWNTGHTSPQFWGFSVQKPKITTNYVVTVSQGCSGQTLIDTFTLFIDNPPFTVTIIDDTINCTDGGTTLVAHVTNNTPSFEYEWDDGTNDTIRFVNPAVSTTYYFTATDACGVNSIPASATVYVINDQIFGYAPNKNIACIGDTAVMEVFASGGYPPYSYYWSSGGTDSVEVVVSAGSSTNYSVSITDICGLDTIVLMPSLVVLSYPDLVIEPLEGDTFKCQNNPITINNVKVTGGSGDYLVSWDNWLTTHDFFWAIVDSTVSYTVQVADQCNKDSAMLTVTYVVETHPQLLVNLPPDTHLCQQEQVELLAEASGGTGVYTYHWNTGAASSVIGVRSNGSQTYSVTVTDECGKTAKDDISIEISQPVADFDYFFYDSYHVGFNNLSENGAFYFWQFGDGDTSTFFEPLKEYQKSREYFVRLTVTDSSGCIDSVYKKIIPPVVAFIPNAFTPNGDGLNETFKVFGAGFKNGFGLKEFRIAIFNRWGAEVFSSYDPDFEWDGTINGKEASRGLYIYRITIEGYGTQKIEMTGYVSIIE